jgi:hypothetical protein
MFLDRHPVKGVRQLVIDSRRRLNENIAGVARKATRLADVSGVQTRRGVGRRLIPTILDNVSGIYKRMRWSGGLLIL